MDLFGETPDEAEAPAESLADFPDDPAQAFTHPRLMTQCLGHEKQEQHLLELFNEGRIPHGLVITGLKGIGKATFAYRLAKFILKYGGIDPNQDDMFGDTPPIPETMDVAPDDKVTRLLSSGAHPDMLMIEPEKTGITVDDIRKAIPFLHMTASYSGWRIVLIDDADTMNRAAQNALLKVLEEPPKNTLLILVTHRLGALIPTIRSRTQTLNFKSPNKENFESILSLGGYELTPDQSETLYYLCEGRVGKAVEYIEAGGLDTLTRLVMMFEAYPQWDWPALHVLAEEFARKGQDQAYKNFTELFLWAIKSLVQSKARGLPLASPVLQRASFENLLRQSSLEQLLKICENLEDHFRKVEFANLDKRQGVLHAFGMLAA